MRLSIVRCLKRFFSSEYDIVSKPAVFRYERTTLSVAANDDLRLYLMLNWFGLNFKVT